MHWRPRPNFQRLEQSAWLSELRRSLSQCGADGQSGERYLQEHRTVVSVRPQSAGARWTLAGHIQIHPRYLNGAPNAPYTLSLIIHEIRHLQQGPLTALSVYGELDAWQAQFGFLKSFSPEEHPLPAYTESIAALMSLRLDWDRSNLARARGLMKAYAGDRYRIDLLPLYPLGKELAYRFCGHQPTDHAGTQQN